MVNKMREHFPGAGHLTIFGGGVHDYKGFILNAPEFQTIEHREVAKAFDNNRDKPEDVVPFGCWIYGRLWHDRALNEGILG